MRTYHVHVRLDSEVHSDEMKSIQPTTEGCWESGATLSSALFKIAAWIEMLAKQEEINERSKP